ncbi:MAG: hypothetical protein R2909_11340 [Gemmatimonadales bacterium]
MRDIRPDRAIGVWSRLRVVIALALLGCGHPTSPPPAPPPPPPPPPAPAAKLAFVVQPANALAGEPLAPAVRVELQSAAGSRVTTATDAVTLSLGPVGTGTLSGTVTVAAVAGVATFSDLVVDTRASGYTLTAAAGGLTGATSQAFRVVTPFLASELAAGRDFTCFLDWGGHVYCAGLNDQGQLGDGTTTNRAFPEPTAGPPPSPALQFVHLSAGGAHACGTTTLLVTYCWGSNSHGQLGIGTNGGNQLVPSAVAGGAELVWISTGARHSCGTTTPPVQAYCWGDNTFGQLGDGHQSETESAPVQVAGGLDFVFVAAGVDHSCATVNDGSIYCWGRNDHGQLGDGTTADRALPTRVVSGGVLFSLLAVGDGYTCALTSGGEGYCWGRNEAGQLGDGTTTERTTPTLIVTPGIPAGQPAISGISAGSGFTCGLFIDQTVRCWGLNTDGQLGNGATGAGSLSPTMIAGGLNPFSAFVGGRHACAIDQATPYCWGANGSGALGRGTTTSSPSPARVVY